MVLIGIDICMMGEMTMDNQENQGLTPENDLLEPRVTGNAEESLSLSEVMPEASSSEDATTLLTMDSEGATTVLSEGMPGAFGGAVTEGFRPVEGMPGPQGAMGMPQGTPQSTMPQPTQGMPQGVPQVGMPGPQGPMGMPQGGPQGAMPQPPQGGPQGPMGMPQGGMPGPQGPMGMPQGGPQGPMGMPQGGPQSAMPQPPQGMPQGMQPESPQKRMTQTQIMRQPGMSGPILRGDAMPLGMSIPMPESVPPQGMMPSPKKESTGKGAKIFGLITMIVALLGLIAVALLLVFFVILPKGDYDGAAEKGYSTSSGTIPGGSTEQPAQTTEE